MRVMKMELNARHNEISERGGVVDVVVVLVNSSRCVH